ncbi:unnamed protein product, partial [Ranitomeya imitator]
GFTYPPHVGLSIGTPTDPSYVLMEVHYDNPHQQEGLIDSSGIKLYYTPHIRKYDAGVLEAGIWVSLYHMIPPGMPAFSSEGHCTMECLEEALNHEQPDGIHVFAVLLHAHQAGQVLRARHFRKGEEQKLLAYDNEFDFNFQEFQYLEEERIILPANLATTRKTTPMTTTRRRRRRDDDDGGDDDTGDDDLETTTWKTEKQKNKRLQNKEQKNIKHKT